MTEHLTQGVPISEIAERFGTPLYLYDGDILRDTYEDLRARLHPCVDIFYSAKANPNVSVCAVLRSLGAGIEVSSLVELRTALRAGADSERIIFLGPGKSRAELEACVEQGIHAIVCESLDELRTVDELRPHERTQILLRVNPTFTAKGALLSMGGKPRQFGIDEATVREARPVLDGLRHTRVSGIHVYMGTRILSAAGIVANTSGILDTADKLADELGIELATVDIGGGFGVPYFDNESALDVPTAVAGINAAVAEFSDRRPGTRIITELGRYLAGWCGTYVVRARYVKQSMGEWFVVADGGTNHHMAAVGIGSFVKRNFPVVSLSHADEPPSREYTVTGPLCTPNDVVGKSVKLPEIQPGDLIGVLRSGAYGPTASPVQFLSHGYPAEVLVLAGTPHLVRRRDTVEDLLGHQHLVEI
ncbi:MAG TPA: type III PLP-dependent enzyme [Pseudonocardiaceae bacterium]|jgi:diaminopimelate decarboxylase|nr:type III PLP-dependent enzyme [Pseudonocardiaceae bacterium]